MSQSVETCDVFTISKTFNCLEDFNFELKNKFPIVMLVLNCTNLMKENNDHCSTSDSLSHLRGNDDLNNDLCNESTSQSCWTQQHWDFYI